MRFDSLDVERDCNICVGTLIDGGVSVIELDGDLVEFVPVTDRRCTNLCFAGHARHEKVLSAPATLVTVML